MAKASYGPNTALIKGAGTAYKDWSNVPGMYAGLDKLTKAGGDMMAAGIKNREAEQLKNELKTQQQNKAWDDAAKETKERSGSFKSPTDRDLSRAIMERTKSDLLTALNEVPPNQKDIDAAWLAFNNEKAYIDDMVAQKDQWANMDRSAAMNNSGNPYDGNDGRQLDISTAWMNEEYEVTEDTKTGERIFHITLQEQVVGGGEEEVKPHMMYDPDIKEYTTEEKEAVYKDVTYSLTKQELEDMWIPADPAVGAKFFEIKDKFLEEKYLDPDNVKAAVKGMLPDTTNGLRAFLADPIGHQTFAEMLDKDDSIRAEVEKEVNLSDLFDTGNIKGEGRGDGVIDDHELAKFKLAIVDPYSSVWLDENGNTDMTKWEKYARPIAIEKLSNVIGNKHIGKYGSGEATQDIDYNSITGDS